MSFIAGVLVGVWLVSGTAAVAVLVRMLIERRNLEKARAAREEIEARQFRRHLRVVP